MRATDLAHRLGVKFRNVIEPVELLVAEALDSLFQQPLLDRRRCDEDEARLLGAHGRVRDDVVEVPPVGVERDVLSVHGFGAAGVVGAEEDHLQPS